MEAELCMLQTGGRRGKWGREEAREGERALYLFLSSL